MGEGSDFGVQEESVELMGGKVGYPDVSDFVCLQEGFHGLPGL